MRFVRVWFTRALNEGRKKDLDGVSCGSASPFFLLLSRLSSLLRPRNRRLVHRSRCVLMAVVALAGQKRTRGCETSYGRCEPSARALLLPSHPHDGPLFFRSGDASIASKSRPTDDHSNVLIHIRTPLDPFAGSTDSQDGTIIESFT